MIFFLVMFFTGFCMKMPFMNIFLRKDDTHNIYQENTLPYEGSRIILIDCHTDHAHFINTSTILETS